MGAIVCIILAVIIYAIKILHNSRNLTFDKWCEIFISFFVFTNCLFFGLTLFKLPGGMPYTSTIRIEIYMLILPAFIIMISKRNRWQLPKIHWLWLLFFAVFATINIINPSNINRTATIVALFNIFAYLSFLYIVTSCTSTKVIIRGVYEGLFYALILQGIAVSLYAIGFTQIATFFREGASNRSDLRPGAPGTFAHPNPLGIYLTYLYCFFLSCYLLGYKKRKSLILSIATILVVIPTYSRSSFMSILFATIVLVSLLKTQNSSIFSLKNILTRILPIAIAAVALVFLTPLKNSFIGSNMDEMMVARLLHYYCGLIIFSQHPLLGVGMNSHVAYMTANFNFRELGDTNLVYDIFLFYNPIHNIWLIWLTEFGIIGMIFIIAFFIYFFVKIKPILRSNLVVENKITALTSVGIICCFLVQGMGDPSPVGVQLTQLWALFFFLTIAPQCKMYDNNNKLQP